MTIKLVANAPQAYKFASVIAAVVLALINFAQANIDVVQQLVPHTIMPYVNMAGAAIIVILRVLKQEGLIQDAPADPSNPPKGS